MERNLGHQSLTPYNNGESKSKQVEEMFDNIAPAYDKLNHTLSFGIDKLWRRKAIKWLKPFSPKKVLDIATGTGDFAIKAYQILQPTMVIGTDISEGMMELGRRKVKEQGLENKIVFQKEDCLSLSFADESFDAATVAFGIRNFENLEKGIKEIQRVLRKNGKLVILELSVPEHFPMRQLYTLYSRVYIPFMGKMVSKDNKAYSYLPESIKAFPQGEVIKQIMLDSGFSKVEYSKLTFGICTLYKATK